MKFVISEPLNVHILVEQKDKLKKIQSEIYIEYKIKFSLSELVRLALEHGIPIIDKDRSYINKHIDQRGD